MCPSLLPPSQVAATSSQVPNQEMPKRPRADKRKSRFPTQEPENRRKKSKKSDRDRPAVDANGRTAAGNPKPEADVGSAAEVRRPF